MASIPAPAWDSVPVPSVPTSTIGLHELGRGRSGVVYACREEGFPVARKVFGSEGLTKLVQWALLGAPNPYMWNENAIRCAHLRRQILGELVAHWFEDELYVASSRGWAWNADAGAFELRTQLVDGRAPALKHPLRQAVRDEARTLSGELLPRLQRHLVESGFDGMVWQAGKGNPVALNNFLLDAASTIDSPRWAWIDLESGVPALAPLSPAALLGFYLPRSWRFGRPMFDDVDTERLRAYVNGRGLRKKLIDRVEELDFRQERWKSLPRSARSIGYRHARGALSAEEAAWYRARPLRWYAREARRMIKRLPAAVADGANRMMSGLTALPWRTGPVAVARFLLSQGRREELARRYTKARIDAWVDRKQMDGQDADLLRAHLDREESATFATDFCVHLAIKPFVKGFEYWVCPLLYAVGAIGELSLALAMLAAGPVARTLYTGGRIVQNTARRKERPWTALLVGVLPVVGNFAFPIQLVRSSREEEDELARFLLYDGLARVGAGLPIWGGEDTLTEHTLNRLADHVVRRPASGPHPPSSSSSATSASALE